MRGFSAAICLALLVAGCASNSETPRPAALPELTAYSTRTPGPPSPAAATVTQPPILTPTATSTPQTYQVVRNDTLTGIARRFGISLEALQAANPGVSATALRVGQSLSIPAVTQGTTAVDLSTPVPLEISTGACLPSGTGTVCFVPVHNPSADALEDISLNVTLFDAQGQALASQAAVLPLNILGPDQVLPASVFFEGQMSRAPAEGQLLTAIRLASGDVRYLPATLQNLLVSTAWNGLSANVQGWVTLPEGSKPAASLWVVAVAYDASNQIAGYRRWEWSGKLQPGTSQPFTMAVYSLGPSINHVDVQVEARP